MNVGYWTAHNWEGIGVKIEVGESLLYSWLRHVNTKGFNPKLLRNLGYY